MIVGIAYLRTILERAKNILLIGPEQSGIDEISSLKALLAYFQNQGQRTEAVISKFKSSHDDSIRSQLDRLNSFGVEIDLERAGLRDFSYEIRDNRFFLKLIPTRSTWDKKDVRVGGTDYRFDLIVTVGAPNLESLGEVYKTNSDFFENTTIVNIDRSTQNTHFGQINLINDQARTVREIIYELLFALDHQSLTPLISSLLSREFQKK